MKTFLFRVAVLVLLALFVTGCEYSGMIDDIKKNARSVGGLFGESHETLKTAKELGGEILPGDVDVPRGSGGGLAGLDFDADKLNFRGKQDRRAVRTSGSVPLYRSDLRKVNNTLMNLAERNPEIVSTLEYKEAKKKLKETSEVFADYQTTVNLGHEMGDPEHDKAEDRMIASMNDLKQSLGELSKLYREQYARSD